MLAGGRVIAQGTPDEIKGNPKVEQVLDQAAQPGDVGGHERTVGTGIPADELLQVAGDRLGERHRQAQRQRTAGLESRQQAAFERNFD